MLFQTMKMYKIPGHQLGKRTIVTGEHESVQSRLDLDGVRNKSEERVRDFNDRTGEASTEND